MVASLVIVDFDIKKNEYHKNLCLFLFTFAIIFENYKFVFNIQKYCAICVVTLSCFQNEMNIIMIMYSVCILLTSSANQIEFFFN